jgi:hypothetical protein
MSVRPFRPIKVSIGSRTGHAYNAADLKRQLANLTKNFQALKEHMDDSAVDILYDALNPTFQLSQKYVPKDTGALAESGYLVVEKTTKGVEASMGYAYRGKPYYALYVHEIPRRHASPTRHKFLQAALEEDAGNIQERIVKGFKKAGGANG